MEIVGTPGGFLAYVKQKYGQDYELDCPYGAKGNILTVNDSWHLKLKIISVRAEKLQSITEASAAAKQPPSSPRFLRAPQRGLPIQ